MMQYPTNSSERGGLAGPARGGHRLWERMVRGRKTGGLPFALLFITQKLHTQDAFGILWANAFAARGYDVHVICLEDRTAAGQGALGDITPRFTVHSLGKEHGTGRIRQVLRFWSLIITLRYDRVFIHMSPVWYALGWWWWLLRGIPVYLWYTHYKMQPGVRLFGWFGRRFFCATAQSLPQYRTSPKKIITGHGIDLAFWPKRPNVSSNPNSLLVVHRLSRSKRLELILYALTLLPGFTVDIYGIDAEADYAAAMRSLAGNLGVDGRAVFHGTIPMKKLPAIYTRHRLILNMASETIDKTMLEAMTCGCYPVTTKANAQAIGLPAAPADDTPEAIAAFVESASASPPLPADALYAIVVERHSLGRLLDQMDRYIRSGT
ncbi:MAG: hypothetical protein G01um101425_60 [Candidatus Peregrinibacteria bacterium Gr01-1014_25]|nr:MAG: hypothetical protein G01um101425_60 [Candidatus Peregrinibacteria bacterium Gr01-1014_25]